LSYFPDGKISGWQRISIVAVDTILMIADTISQDIYIAPAAPLFLMQLSGISLKGNTLDLRR
jgi:hypothetical protein